MCNSLQLSVTPFSYLLRKNLDDIPSDYIKGKFQMIRKRLLFSSDMHLYYFGLLQKIPVSCYAPSRPAGEGNGNPLQYSCLENPMDVGAQWAAVHGVTKSWTRLSNFTFTFHFHALEKKMATHSSVLAWRTPGTGEPGGLPSMGSHRVGHD